MTLKMNGSVALGKYVALFWLKLRRGVPELLNKLWPPSYAPREPK